MTTKPIRNKETECKCKNKFCCTNSNCSANHKKPCNCPNNPLRNKETVKEEWEGWEADLAALLAKYREPKHEEVRLIKVLYFCRTLLQSERERVVGEEEIC